jgi:hypothetical protein
MVVARTHDHSPSQWEQQMKRVRPATIGALVALVLSGAAVSLPSFAVGPDSSTSPSGGDKTNCDRPAQQSDSTKPNSPSGGAATSKGSPSSGHAQDCNDDSAQGSRSGNSSSSGAASDSNNSSREDSDKSSKRIPAEKSPQR